MKTIQCKACDLGDIISNEFNYPMDLDANLHTGFTIGNKGKIMYWYFIWHSSSGNASIYTSETIMRKSYIKGDQLITIHFKD
jgi:hypothetical protein